MNKEAREYLAAHRKYVILEYAKGIGNNKKACRDFNVPKSSFYEWKKAYAEGGKGRPISKHAAEIPDFSFGQPSCRVTYCYTNT